MIGGTEAIPGSGQYIIDCSTIDSLPSLTFIINGKDYVVNENNLCTRSLHAVDSLVKRQ